MAGARRAPQYSTGRLVPGDGREGEIEMFHEPKTQQEAQTHRYGGWAGNEKGRPFDPRRCAAEVMSGYHFFQCTRKPGHGPGGLYCKQHAKCVKGGLPGDGQEET